MTTVLIVLAVWLLVSIPVGVLLGRRLAVQSRPEQRYVQIRPEGWMD